MGVTYDNLVCRASSHGCVRGSGYHLAGGFDRGFPMVSYVFCTYTCLVCIFMCVVCVYIGIVSTSVCTHLHMHGQEAMLRVPEAQRMEVKRHVEAKMREMKIRTVRKREKSVRACVCVLYVCAYVCVA